MAPARTHNLRALLSLDVSGITGWAFGGFADRIPATGIWPLPRRDDSDVVGARIAALENTLSAALDAWCPTVVVMAEAFPGRNMDEAMAKFAMLGIVRSECWRRKIRCLVQPEGTVRKEVLGRGGGSSETMKQLVMDWCHRQGIDVEDHNAGDAAVLWRWTRDELVRQRIAA